MRSLLRNPHVRNTFAILALVFVVAVAAWLVTVPWLVAPPPDTPLTRYLPVRDGGSVLRAEYDGEGKFQKWSSTNLRLYLRGRVVVGELRKAEEDALKTYLQGDDTAKLTEDDELARLQNVQVYREDTVDLNTLGITRRSTVSLRDARGDSTLALYYNDSGTDSVFDPPALVLPADLSPARGPWNSKGKLGTLDYELRGRVLQTGAFPPYTDCIQVELTTLLSDATFHNTETDHAWLCAGAGIVQLEAFDENQKPTLKTVIVSETGQLPNVPGLIYPPAPSIVAAPLSTAMTGWTLEHVARLGRLVSAGEATIPPTWVPTDPPLVLTAGPDGDLVAYEAQGTGSWRFHTGGAIYGPPAFDAARGRIYFGSSDKHLYALDVRGFFLWAFPTSDNVASRPVVVGDTIVFGGEDRTIYGLDANTGQEKWRASTGGPVVSSPAASGSLVVIGSDDGGIYALDAATGAQKWLYTAGVIEAPIVLADGVAYAASRDRNMYAVDVNTGQEIWTANVGDVLRTAPALTADRVLVTTFSGNVIALDRATGHVLNRTPDAVYTGTPLVIGDALIVAGNDGVVYQLNADLAQVATWRTADSNVSFRFGPTVGGGALWLGDSRGVIWRLGAPELPAPLTLRWRDSVGTPPLSTYLLTTTPVVYGDALVTLDNNNRIYTVNPRSGGLTAHGQITAEATAAVRLDPVLAGDTLLTVIGQTLWATDLRTGNLLWKADGATSFVPPVVSEDTVLWLTQSYTQAGLPTTLSARDLATGTERWQVSFQDLVVSGGIVARDGVVYLASPASAYEIATGKQLWKTTSGELGMATPALNADGTTLFLAHLGITQNNVAALDIANGQTRWQQDVQGAVTFLEPLWFTGDTVIVPFSSSSLSQGLGGMVALDAATGAERWRYNPPVPRIGNLTVQEGMVWFMLEDEQVLGLDAQTGKLTAQYRDVEANLSGVGSFQRPLVSNGLLVAPVGTQLLGLELPPQK